MKHLTDTIYLKPIKFTQIMGEKFKQVSSIALISIITAVVPMKAQALPVIDATVDASVIAIGASIDTLLGTIDATIISSTTAQTAALGTQTTAQTTALETAIATVVTAINTQLSSLPRPVPVLTTAGGVPDPVTSGQLLAYDTVASQTGTLTFPLAATAGRRYYERVPGVLDPAECPDGTVKSAAGLPSPAVATSVAYRASKACEATQDLKAYKIALNQAYLVKLASIQVDLEVTGNLPAATTGSALSKQVALETLNTLQAVLTAEYRGYMDALDYRIAISEEKYQKLSAIMISGMPATSKNVIAAAAIKTVLGAAISFGAPTTPYIQ